MAERYYAVAHGRRPGVYEEWSDVQEQIHHFPQAVYKKFATKEEAEAFYKARQPERVSMDVDESAKKFYAVARGKVIGIFTNYDEVKKYIADYPQPMYKKFEVLSEAKAYFKKYTSGEEDHSEGTKADKGHDECESTGTDHQQEDHTGDVKKDKEKEDVEKSNEKEPNESNEKDGKHGSDKEKSSGGASKEKVYYAVARGHKTGVYATWAECQEQTKDFKGAKFKKFTDEEDAKLFAEGKTLKQIEDRKRQHEVDDDNDAAEQVEPKKVAKDKEKA